MDADTKRALAGRIVGMGKSSNPELAKQRLEERRRRSLAPNGPPRPGSLDWYLASKGVPPERSRAAGVDIPKTTISDSESAIARLGYHVKFKEIPLKVTYKPAPPRKKLPPGTTSHPEEEKLAAMPPLSNPYLEKRRRTFMMTLSSAGISWPPQRKRARSLEATSSSATGTTSQGEGGACVPNKDLGESSESMVEKLNLEDTHISN